MDSHIYTKWHCPCSTVIGAKVPTYPNSPSEVVKYITLGRRGVIMFYNVHKGPERYQHRENDKKVRALLVKERPTVELGQGWPKAVSRPSRSSMLEDTERLLISYHKIPFSSLGSLLGLFFLPMNLHYHQSNSPYSLHRAKNSLGQLFRSSSSAP